LPKDYILIPGSTFVEYEDLPSESEDGEVVVRTRGTLYGVMLSRDLFASYLATQYIENYQNQPLAIINPQELQFELENEGLTFADIQDAIDLTVSGDAVLRWVVEEQVVKAAVSGVAKAEALGKISAMPGVQDARLELVPGFMRSIPTSEEKIEVLFVDQL